jgi:hypothetical protein
MTFVSNVSDPRNCTLRRGANRAIGSFYVLRSICSQETMHRSTPGRRHLLVQALSAFLPAASEGRSRAGSFGA